VMLHSMAYRAMAFNVRDLPHGFWSHSNDIAAVLATIVVLGGYLYAAGLFGLSRELETNKAYNLDSATAWHAATLASIPLVERQGLGVLYLIEKSGGYAAASATVAWAAAARWVMRSAREGMR